MIEGELQKEQLRASRETLVMKKTDEGYRVYSPGNPARNYLVSGSLDAPTCSCRDFEHNSQNLDGRCKHILAVVNRLTRAGNGDTRSGEDAREREERRGIQEEEPQPGDKSSSGPSLMLLKRSVSPDGRIDSLSVEFTCPVLDITPHEVKKRASRALEIQSQIVEGFLAQGNSATNNGASRNGDRADHDRKGNGAVEARLLRIGGMDTRYGRRLFINVQVDGDILKLFGSRKQLAEAIEGTGFPNRAEPIEEGVRLDLPCRVTTKPSDDGRYINVDEVLPADAGRRASR